MTNEELQALLKIHEAKIDIVNSKVDLLKDFVMEVLGLTTEGEKVEKEEKP